MPRSFLLSGHAVTGLRGVLDRALRQGRRPRHRSHWASGVARALAAGFLALPFTLAAHPKRMDLNTLIAKQCGPPGYRADSGCTLELGRGTFRVSETVKLGNCTTHTVRNSVTLQGRAGGMMTAVPRFTTAGTTLRWTGPPGGVVFDACGASFLSFRDLTIDAAGAGTGIRVSADNEASAISHFVELRNVVVDGAEIGVHITGRHLNDQVDFVALENVSLSNVGIGYLQDSQQSVGGRIETVEVTARKKGFEIENGSLVCEGCYVGSLPDASPDFIGFHLTFVPTTKWLSHHQVSIEHSHMELTRGRFIVEDAGADYPITLMGNSYALHCPQIGCEMTVLDSRAKGPVVMIGDVLQGLAQKPKARICHRGPDLVRLGVHRKAQVATVVWECAGKPPAPAQ